jgi:hypothetical protein
MKYIKTYENFNALNETVYSTGFGGDLVYSNRGDSAVKRKTLSILKSGKWMKTPAGKFALDEANSLADMWKERDPSTWPGFFKDYTKDIEGNLKYTNFLNQSALITCVLDELSKREDAVWVDAGLERNKCFHNAATWANENKETAIGGICIAKDQLDKFWVESLVVHAFCKKGSKYYEVTLPNEQLAAKQIYWPLLSFKNSNEMEISEKIWSYAMGIEEGVNEYLAAL